MNLHKIGGDIKKRIDMYISGLYDNELLGHYADNFNRFVDEHVKSDHKNHLTEDELEVLKARLNRATQSVGSQLPMRRQRPHSINSEEARGSTSDSTDSGLGVYTNTNVHESAGIEKNAQVNNVTATYATGEIASPPMSELERRSRLMLRNGSLNDIHLIGESILPHLPLDESHYYDEQDLMGSSANEMTPRFCHNCGTKYPNTLAKFCYECGDPRFVTVT